MSGEERLTTSSTPPTSPEMVVRTLRHEIGDLLQTVYATAAILQERLPPDWALERRIVADLRRRGEACKNLLDSVHDLVCPLQLNLEKVNLGDLAVVLSSGPATRHLQIALRAEPAVVPDVLADPRRMSQLGNLLLGHALETAATQVRFDTQPGPGPGEVAWVVSSDGPGVPADQLPRIAEPFSTTRHSLSILLLALARKIVLLHGGRFTAANRPEGGFQVETILPPAPPNAGS